MNRIALEDENGERKGAWFNSDTAEKYQEKREHDGNNFYSIATGSKTAHENLHHTKSGKWILNSWSQYQGCPDVYQEVSENYAVKWFIKNEFRDSEIPEYLREKKQNLIDSLEV